MKDLSRNVTLFCDVCGNDQFSSLDNLISDFENASDESKIQCSVCKKIFTKAELIEVNEEVINEASYGLYNISVTNGAVIDIEFNEISSEVPQFTAPVCFVDEESPDTTYTFVRINMLLPETDFGVIVSSDSDKLDAEDVDSANTFMLPALNGSNAFGEYGIKIIDKAEGNVLGNTYYVRPYALFNGTYYYQNPVTVNVNTVQ